MKWERREDASESVLTMLVWAAGSILVTRLWFVLTNNPQIAFGGWHIAHVLFGGLAMLAALLMGVIYQSKNSHKWMTVLGGVGWGLFIDEVGKYVTKDNNYWFRPAIIIIYISFVLMFLLYRRLAKHEKDNGVNLKMIRWITKIFHVAYNRVFRRKVTLALLGGYSVYFVIDRLVDGARIWLSPERVTTIRKFYEDYDILSKTDTYMIGFKVGFDLITAIMLAGGWYWIARKRQVRGLSYFRYGLLINILLGSVFKFYFEQFSGVFSLALSLLIWNLLGELQVKKNTA